jgi:hypothetical protein
MMSQRVSSMNVKIQMSWGQQKTTILMFSLPIR